MGLPQYAIPENYVLTADDLTREVLDGFEQHCVGTDRALLAGALSSRPTRARPAIKSPYDESGQYSDEAIFLEAFR